MALLKYRSSKLHSTSNSAMHLGKKIVLQFYVFVCVGWLGLSNLRISGNNSTHKSSLQDQDEQQISFFVKHFPVKNSVGLVATDARNFLDVQFLRFVGSVRPSLRLCKILVQFVTLLCKS